MSAEISGSATAEDLASAIGVTQQKADLITIHAVQPVTQVGALHCVDEQQEVVAGMENCIVLARRVHLFCTPVRKRKKRKAQHRAAKRSLLSLMSAITIISLLHFPTVHVVRRRTFNDSHSADTISGRLQASFLPAWKAS